MKEKQHSTNITLPDRIRIRNARVHNLKNVSVELPRYQLIVITGKSGSGKSSLAFDTIYAEGQRRYMESLSTYARQFVRAFEKPDVDSIEGLSPPIAIDQRTVGSNPRSTVGTLTEVYDYLRLLFAHAGAAHCPSCGRALERQTPMSFVDRLRKLFTSTAIGPSFVTIAVPLSIGHKKELQTATRFFQRHQLTRVRRDRQSFVLQSGERLDDAFVGSTIEAEVATIPITSLDQAGTLKLLETVLSWGKGLIARWDDDHTLPLTTELYCEVCERSIPPFEPRNFSFNSPYGACEGCGGLGTQWIVDPQLVIPNTSLTLSEGAIRPLSRLLPHQGGAEKILEELSHVCSLPLNVAVNKFTPLQQKQLFHGTGSPSETDQLSGGIVGFLQYKYAHSDSEYIKSEIERTMRLFPCPQCNGKRLKPAALAVQVSGSTVSDVVNLPLVKLSDFLRVLSETNGKEKSAQGKLQERVIKTLCTEMLSRIEHLVAVGLEYLTLDRSVTTLAGGEAQRIRLATQLRSHLVDLVYVLDEPSIGLHQRDNARLIETLKQLRDLGNTVIVVEHDEETIRSADYVIDMGPDAGAAGGMVVASGLPSEIANNPKSITGAYLSGRARIDPPGARRKGNGKSLTVHGAREFNLKKFTLSIPLGEFVAVTGVSGSGKSTLVDDIIARTLLKHFYHAKDLPGAHDKVTGIEHLDKVIMIDQSPIGRTPRSNPATYTGIFTLIRDLFIEVPEAKVKGLKAGHFSFNVRGGRCETCQGGGYLTISMQFLPDMTVECDACEGRRYLPEILEVRWREKNIAEVLQMTVQEALQFFQPSHDCDTRLLVEKLSILDRVGLGYVKLGQPATTLSGGEAQRIKLATELSRRSTGRTLYILDEPTTGLHADDIKKLLMVLQELVDLGNTVLVIEHNLDVISAADWVVDLGPEGGEKGGYVIAQGTPEQVSGVQESWTGQYLKKMFERATVPVAKKKNGMKK